MIFYMKIVVLRVTNGTSCTVTLDFSGIKGLGVILTWHIGL